VSFIALGSNLAEPIGQIRTAFEQLHEWPGIVVQGCSSLYRTSPVGYCDQPDFINACAQIETGLSPHDLLDALQRIEQIHGRERGILNGPRTLDLDILLYGDRILADERLTIPHPRMHERAFVLVPLADMDMGILIPGHGYVAQLLEKVDQSGVERIKGT
ncbi:MAG: 2-amino-4-hydroxy-6-hydroxymethyldihydropteridine diphosphokinase, partial [Pseudomonadota bacterium]|nr:2-amino-4-hydroxy-6-hydroxymethyldihydropteridine diphosphokinase [Pseudomonadota bacterium]